MRCDLALLIDQFEELFAASVSEEERPASSISSPPWWGPAAFGS